MQSVILDTQRSLAKIVREIDKLLLGDGILPLVCPVSIILTSYVRLPDLVDHALRVGSRDLRARDAGAGLEDRYRDSEH